MKQMILKDYHMHTTYCDGNNTAEEMVLAAIKGGLEEVGISGHSHTSFDESYCMSHETTQQYRQELLALREKYADQISVKIGLEMDRWSDADTSGFDYLIGSVHYLRLPYRDGFELFEGCFPQGEYVYITVDETPEILLDAADAFFDGDLISLACEYFSQAATVAEATGCDIIGHFDLITKFNEGGKLFDENDPRYIEAWKKAADQLLRHNIPFEINTGAMSKGYRTAPYPAKAIRDYIRARSGRLILSSDSHRTGTICYGFEAFQDEIK